MKKIFLFAAAAALFAACSSNDLSVSNQQQAEAQPADGAVAFDVYTQKANTRGGVPGSLTTTDMKKTTPTPSEFNEAGFGVFGYYTDNNEYDDRSVPNFMYNQQVTWSGSSAWTYAPVLYWPNEYGKNAISDDEDKLTFFAYAPWIDIIPASGKIAKLSTETDEEYKEREQWGIVGMTRNTTQGDPIIKYIASFDANKSVDLCWGVADNGDGRDWNMVQTASTGLPQTAGIADGKPWKDLERPASQSQKVKFTFKHALAQMQVKIDADIDVDGRGHTSGVDGKTRVWVREVTFKGFALKGSLNLNNETANKAKWLDFNGQNELVGEGVTIYDGRKDGKEGVNGAIATNEKTQGLNNVLVQDEAYKNGGNVYGATPLTNKDGVTNDPVNLFENGGIFHVIPIENEEFEVEIVYDIETVDENLAQNLSDGATKGSSVENRIWKKISFGTESTLKTGHSYTLNLHLGMNSVKFDAYVNPWVEEKVQDVDLPLNVPAFAATTTPYEITLPYDATSYGLAITGLHAGETVMGAFSDWSYQNKSHATDATEGATALTGWAVTTPVNVQANGYVVETLSGLTTNTTTSNRAVTATFTAAQSGEGPTVFNFTQKAHPLELTILDTTIKNAPTIHLGRSGDITDGYGWISKGLTDKCVALTANDETGNVYGNKAGETNHIYVWLNGVQLTWASAVAANSFTFGDTSGDITLNSNLKKGDFIKVELQTGDAPVETATFTVE